MSSQSKATVLALALLLSPIVSSIGAVGMAAGQSLEPVEYYSEDFEGDNVPSATSITYEPSMQNISDEYLLPTDDSSFVHFTDMINGYVTTGAFYHNGHYENQQAMYLERTISPDGFESADSVSIQVETFSASGSVNINTPDSSDQLRQEYIAFEDSGVGDGTLNVTTNGESTTVDPQSSTAAVSVQPENEYTIRLSEEMGDDYAQGRSSHNSRKNAAFVAMGEITVSGQYNSIVGYRSSSGVSPTTQLNGTGLSSPGELTRSFNLNNSISDARFVYVRFTVLGDGSGSYELRQQGQQLGGGSINGNQVTQVTERVNLSSGNFQLSVESDGVVRIDDVRVIAYEEDTAGNPLEANTDPFSEESDQKNGFDHTIGVLVSALQLTTTSLFFVVGAALAIGAIMWVYGNGTALVRGGQSLLVGGVILMIALVAVEPVFGTITWLATGDTDRASFDNPDLEAEPPVYYEETFDSGELGSVQVQEGGAFPENTGEGDFVMSMSGSPARATVTEEINLGEQLSTGYVSLEATANSRANSSSTDIDYVYVNVYVDGEQVVDREQWVRSYDGQQTTRGRTVEFPLNGTEIRVEIIAEDNDGGEARAQIDDIQIGAIEGNQAEN